MRIVTIHITRSAVIHDVTQLTAYLAVKHPDSEALCDRVPVVPADDEILDAAWRIGCAQLDLCLRHRLVPSHCVPTCEAYSVSLLVPNHCGARQGEAVQAAAEAYLAAVVTAYWLSVAMPEAENKYATEAIRCLRMLDTTISRRHRRMQVI